jgi:spermidine dehydrogenase
VYTQFPVSPEETGEFFDLIIVGGGLTGLMAAHEYAKQSGGSRRCLILENHPIFGGEARQNDFQVDGYRLVGPQGSNDFYPPAEGSNTQIDQFFTDFNLPRKYAFQEWDSNLKPLRFSYDNYTNMDGFEEGHVDVSYYFDQKCGASKPVWMRNIWSNNLAGTPFSDKAKADLLRWRKDAGNTGDDDPHFLDTITYKHYLENIKGYDPEVTKFSQPMVGLLGGVGSDAISARVGHGLVSAYHTTPRLTLSFPGGNSTMARHLMRGLIPGSISGEFTFKGVLNGRVNFAALDLADQSTRIRLRSTVNRVEHQHRSNEKDLVLVTYERDGRIYQTRAHTVIMASGGWITKRVVADLPDDIRSAYEEFQYAPALIANVALNNWRFLYRLGAPAVRLDRTTALCLVTVQIFDETWLSATITRPCTQISRRFSPSTWESTRRGIRRTSKVSSGACDFFPQAMSSMRERYAGRWTRCFQRLDSMQSGTLPVLSSTAGAMLV